MTVIGHYEPPPRKRPIAHRPSRKSQCGRILTCLERGGWWTTRQLLQEVPAITHSRISELRNTWGYTIEHRTTGPGAGGSEYRLTTLPREAGYGDDGEASSWAPASPGSAAEATLPEPEAIRSRGNRAVQIGSGRGMDNPASTSGSGSADTPPDTAVHDGAQEGPATGTPGLSTPDRPGQVDPDIPAPVLLPGQLSFTEAA
jgi:hypothetical protein